MQMRLSPSTRRAWIEIKISHAGGYRLSVALHPEGVDRNIKALIMSPRPGPSPSTRRAWIEIST